MFTIRGVRAFTQNGRTEESLKLGRDGGTSRGSGKAKRLTAWKRNFGLKRKNIERFLHGGFIPKIYEIRASGGVRHVWAEKTRLTGGCRYGKEEDG